MSNGGLLGAIAQGFIVMAVLYLASDLIIRAARRFWRFR